MKALTIVDLTPLVAALQSGMRLVARAAVLSAACCVLCVACSRHFSRSATRQVDVFVTEFDLDGFPAQAAAIAASRRVCPALWVVAGDPFADGAPGDTGYRSAVCRLLRAGGVDAMLLSPSWFGGETGEVRRAVDDAGCYVLGCGVVDSVGRSVGHQLMVKRIGPLRVGLTGVWPEMTSAVAARSGFGVLPADRAVRAAIELLRPRVDAVGVVLGPGELASRLDAEFVVGSGAVAGAVKPVTSERLSVVVLTFSGGVLTGVANSVRPVPKLDLDSEVVLLARELMSVRP